MKKNYNKPEMNISVFANENVVTSSGLKEASQILRDSGISETNIHKVNYLDLLAF